MYFKRYCDCCGRKKELKEIILQDDSGTAFYCDDCKRENKRPTVEEWEKKNSIITN